MSSLGFWSLSNDYIEAVILVLLWVFQSFLNLLDGSVKILFFSNTQRQKKSYICPKFNELAKSRKLSFCLESHEVTVGPHQKGSVGGGEVWILGFWSSDATSTKDKYPEFLSSRQVLCLTGGGIPNTSFCSCSWQREGTERGYSDHRALTCA